MMVCSFFLLTGMQSDARSFSKAPLRSLLIVYSGNTLGELKPCGCAKEEDQGGFERRMSYLKKISEKTKNILLVDTGDNFKEPSRQGKIKARYIIQAMSKLKYDAVVLGDKDLVYGEKFLDENGSIPWLISNVKLDSIHPPQYKIKKFKNGLTVAMLAMVDPELYYGAKHSGAKITDPRESFEKLVNKIKLSYNPDLIVLLTHMKREKAISLLGLDDVDVIINGHIDKDTDIINMNAIKQNGKIFVQPGERGQKMGELVVNIDNAGEKMFKQRTVRLDSNIKYHPEMIEWYKNYNKEVEDLFFASLDDRKNKSQDKKIYATDQACLVCHPSIHEEWNKSRHAHAYETLNQVNKAFDPECLKCHVTGLDRLGGFISEVDTPELKNVQCEVCHGPMLQHSQNPQASLGVDARQACKLCHVKNHSPNFNFSKYWLKIKH